MAYIKNIATGAALLAIAATGQIAEAQVAQEVAPVEKDAIYRDAAAPTARRVDDLLRRMTLEEKVGQLGFEAPRNERLGIPRMNWVETLHGVLISRGELTKRGFAADIGPTIFPQAIALGSTWNPELIEKVASVIALEGRSLDFHQSYAPVLDVARDPRFGRVEETFGEDPFLVSRLGVAYVNGLQGRGKQRYDARHMLATGKHFVGYHESAGGLNGAYANVAIRTLYEVHLPPFAAAIREAGLGSIMPGHTDINGTPAHMDKWLLNDVLRQELAFDGLVVSDNIDIYRLFGMQKVARNEAEAARLAISAGVDLELDLSPGHRFAVYPTLVKAVRDGVVPETTIDTSVRRILRAKYDLGLFDRTANPLDPLKTLGNPAHRALALNAAKQAVVLLKNDGALPLRPAAGQTIAIIGPHANQLHYGGYTGTGFAPGATLADGLKAALPRARILTAQGTTIAGGETAGFAEAIAAAQQADVIVMAIGESRETCGEGADSDDLRLTGAQQKLFDVATAGGKPVITVLANCRPLIIPEVAARSNALLESWYLGSEAGNALAAILTGAANPGGKLTMTFPRKVGQLPSFYQQKPNFTGLGRGQYFMSDRSPAFPFGFGLSYTTFSITEPKLSQAIIAADGTTKLSVRVRNTGRVAGDEVVQVYVSHEFASVGQWDKELKAFRRVSLAPGEERMVEFSIGANELAILGRDLKPVVEAGKHILRIGNSSASLTAVPLTVGTAAAGPAREVKTIEDKDDAVITGQETVR